MLGAILIGAGYALSASLQPGPLQAFFLSRVAEHGWRRTLPAAFAPLVSDGPIALTAILLVHFLPDSFHAYLQLAGGFLLLFFAREAYLSFRSEGIDQPDESLPSSSTPKTVFQAALVNLLNPNPYLGWSLVMGPAVLAAWSESPGLAAALLLAFYTTMISSSMVIIYLMGRASLLGPQARKSMALISTILLVGLGVYFVYLAGSQLVLR